MNVPQKSLPSSKPTPPFDPMTVPLSYHWESTSPGEDKTIPHFNAVGGMKAEQIGGRCNLYIFESDVRQIRAELEAGVRQVDLAKRYGVANATINLIALRRNWRHL